MTSHEFHERANIFPLMGTSELESLAADIANNGQREPITLYEGKILDGRNRYRACELAGVEPVTKVATGIGDPLGYVLSLNLERRHLNAGQRAFVALEVERIEAERNPPGGDRRSKEFQGEKSVTLKGKARDKAGAALNVSGMSVSKAKAIMQDAPSLVDEVRSGKKSLDKAYKEMKRRRDYSDPNIPLYNRFRMGIASLLEDVDGLPPDEIEARHKQLCTIGADDVLAEVEEIEDPTARLRAFARIAENRQPEMNAAEILVRLERKLGRLLKEMAPFQS